MKKIASIIVLAVSAASSFFAVDLSAGLGTDLSFARVQKSVSKSSANSTEEISSLNLKAFLDATYAVAEAGFSASFSDKVSGKDMGFDRSDLAFSLLGKYPVALGPRVVMFPAAGFEFDKNLTYEYKGKSVDMGKYESSLDQLWVKGGVGADIGFTPEIFLRSTAIIGYKFASELDRDTVRDLKKTYSGASLTTFKFDIGLALGYRF